jgi:N,N-dimethylformamidase beta subunit-like protein
MNRRGLFKASVLGGAAGLIGWTARADTQATALGKPAVLQQVWTSFYSGTRVWGYVNKHSIVPGEGFSLMLSVGPGAEPLIGTVEVFRIGYAPDKAATRSPDASASDHELVFQSKPAKIVDQEVQMTACSLGLTWGIAFADFPTDAWRPGYYTIDFISQSDGQRDLNVAFIVVTDPSRQGDVLVWLSTNTYQAYNNWGGASFYESALTGDRAQMVAFDRPTPPHFFEYEFFLVTWLERLAVEQGWKIGYTTNFDMHREPQFASDYKLLISGSHNEYWSKEEFEQVHRRIFQEGKNTIFFGANSAYWQVRYADLAQPPNTPSAGRQLVCYKEAMDPIAKRVDERTRRLLSTIRFRDEARLPETMLAGVAYQSYFEYSSDKRYPYVVVDVSLPFFNGTGYKIGDVTGDIIGYEWDNTDPDGDGKRLWDPSTSLIPELDRNRITVVFSGTPVDLENKPGKAEAVYFVSPAGAKVFSTGSIRWAWGLGKSTFEQNSFKCFNRNLLCHLLDK